MTIDKNVCLTILKKIFGNGTYELVDWKLTCFEERVGYHGSHNSLLLTVSVSNEKKMLKFFVKNATDNQEIFDGYWKKLKCFEKEYHMLDYILAKMEGAVGKKLAPKCYLNELNKFVVLEDLEELGYKSEKKRSKELDYIWKTIEKFAIFHSASIILENNNGKKIQDLFPEINFENVVCNPYEDGYVMKAACTMVSYLVKHRFDEIPSQSKDTFINWFIDTELELVKPSLKYRNVVCHGDPWYMNFMYKSTENRQCEDVIMVDFQFSRIAPPALEIQQYISGNFSLETIRSIKEKVTTIYFNKMKETLNKANIDISQILPREHLNESFDLYQPFGLISNALYKAIQALPPHHLQAMDTPAKYVKLMTSGNPELAQLAFDKDENYRNIMTNAIMDCYRLFLEVSMK